MSGQSQSIPRWVPLLIVLLALQQPAVHLLIRLIPPEGMTPTGLHIPDSALFLQSMRMFETGFHSLYATCQSPVGDQSLSFYSVPHLWLYGVLGLFGQALGLDFFLLYGFANGVGAALYLWAAYAFLRAAVPRLAGRAFLLFCLSAGPGGLLYLLTGLLGLHTHTAFETYFFRFAAYDLMEGPLLQPLLYFPRLYYTLSLACCFAALTGLLHRMEGRSAPRGWCLLMIPGAFIDARYGVFTLGLGLLLLWFRSQAPMSAQAGAFVKFSLCAVLGMLPASVLMRTNPAVIQNHLDAGNMAMWISPFLCVAWLHLLLLIKPLRETLRGLRGPARALAWACAGYLVAQGILYVLYQGYYGNLWTGRDGSVASAISDVALLGAVCGLLLAQRRPPTQAPENAGDWLSLWLLGFLALSVTGIGRGWFLQFGPQRLQVFLWMPLCVLTAQGLAILAPRTRALCLGILLSSGVTTLLVSSTCFQAPYFSTFKQYHTEVMRATDARLMEQIGPGTVLAPAPASDVIALRNGNPVVFGIGSFNLTRQSWLSMRTANETFFHPATPDAERQTLARHWCAEWVFCPATWPCAPETIAALRQADWLEPVAGDDTGQLFRMRPAAGG